jgi:hypothetical protein
MADDEDEPTRFMRRDYSRSVAKILDEALSKREKHPK